MQNGASRAILRAAGASVVILLKLIARRPEAVVRAFEKIRRPDYTGSVGCSPEYGLCLFPTAGERDLLCFSHGETGIGQ
jgi:hypothetical protein